MTNSETTVAGKIAEEHARIEQQELDSKQELRASLGELFMKAAVADHEGRQLDAIDINCAGDLLRLTGDDSLGLSEAAKRLLSYDRLARRSKIAEPAVADQRTLKEKYLRPGQTPRFMMARAIEHADALLREADLGLHRAKGHGSEVAQIKKAWPGLFNAAGEPHYRLESDNRKLHFPTERVEQIRQLHEFLSDVLEYHDKHFEDHRTAAQPPAEPKPKAAKPANAEAAE